MFLSQPKLNESIQGMSGAALDIYGDGREDLVIGVPYARKKGATGALLTYYCTNKGFSKCAHTVSEGDGNLGWSLVSRGDVKGDGKGWFASGAHSGSGENVSLSGTVIIYEGGKKPQKFETLEGDDAIDRFGLRFSVSASLHNI